MPLMFVQSHNDIVNFLKGFSKAAGSFDEHIGLNVVPTWLPTEKEVGDCILDPSMRVIADHDFKSGAIFELAPQGFIVTHFFSSPLSAIPAEFISRIWRMDSRHWVTFMVPDGQWEMIKTLQNLGCKPELKPDFFKTVDGWAMKFDGSCAKKNRKNSSPAS